MEDKKEEKKPDLFMIVCLATIVVLIVATIIYNMVPAWNHAQEQVEHEQRMTDIENSPVYKYHYEKTRREMEAK